MPIKFKTIHIHARGVRGTEGGGGECREAEDMKLINTYIGLSVCIDAEDLTVN